jgi:hypothetical protein
MEKKACIVDINFYFCLFELFSYVLLVILIDCILILYISFLICQLVSLHTFPGFILILKKRRVFELGLFGNKGNNKITELRTILQRESQNS